MNLVRLGAVVKRETQRFLRIPIQTLIAPWISATLYILVFGLIIGSHIQLFEEMSYIDFVLPGILMMNVVLSALGQSSTSLFFQRWTRVIHETLTSPLSYVEMITGYVIGAVARSVIVATGIYVIALFFTGANLSHVGWFFFYAVMTAIIFSLVGLLVGLWAEKMEHLSILQTFVITPLLYVGGVFNSISMLPEKLQMIARFNPFFYLVDGLRYSMIGFTESNIMGGVIGLSAGAFLLFWIVLTLFKRGWKLRV
ncbi:TPA: ABC transporter permease [Candidatus Uhrbacteria bacterium]|nr:ABC transporter permease [Candidatus Uhrbacteria bacterium]